MAFTEHYNLPEMATGAVDWPAVYNDLVGKVEVGRTIKAVVGEVAGLTVRTPFYISSDGKAYKATSATNQLGLWQSASTAVNIEGFGQVEGVMTYASWTWTANSYIHVDAAGALVATRPPDKFRPFAYALSATELLLIPSFTNDLVIVETTSAVETTLDSRSLGEGKSYLIEARVSAKQGNTNRAAYVRTACAYRPTAGYATIQGSGEIFTIESNPAWDCRMMVSGSGEVIMTKVTGAAGVTVNWKGEMIIIEV